MTGRTSTLVILVVALAIGAYDVSAAVRAHGHNVVAWVLAAIMLLIALASLRKLIRGDYSSSFW